MRLRLSQVEMFSSPAAAAQNGLRAKKHSAFELKKEKKNQKCCCNLCVDHIKERKNRN